MGFDRKRKTQTGLTLVEIIVSLGLTTSIVAVALVMAQSLGQVHGDQSQILDAQDNLRGALSQLRRDIRLAGAGFTSSTVINSTSSLPSPATIPSVRVVNGGVDQSDVLELLTVPGTAIATTLTQAVVADQELLIDRTAGLLFSIGDLALLSNYTDAVLYTVKAIRQDFVLGVEGRTLRVDRAPSFPVASFPAGSLVLKAASLRYSIRTNVPGLPATSLLVLEDGTPLGTTTATAPLAEHIYDLQVAVGVDGVNGYPQDGTLVEVGRTAGDDEWIFNRPGESFPPGTVRVRALRVSVVGRTAQTGAAPSPGRPQVEDRDGGAPDRYRWRVMTETIMIRNAGN